MLSSKIETEKEQKVSERLSRTWETHTPHQKEVGEALLEVYVYSWVHLPGQQCSRIMRVASLCGG